MKTLYTHTCITRNDCVLRIFSLLIRVFLAFAVSAPLANAQPQAPGQLPVMTRYMKVFLEQETQLLQAVKDKNSEAMEKMLAVNFEMRAAHKAGTPVPRAEWIKSALAQTASGDYTMSQMSVQEVGSIAIASFVLTPTAANGTATAAFVVDTWVPEGEGWKLRVRHASALPSGAQKLGHMMGDTATAVDTKKKY